MRILIDYHLHKNMKIISGNSEYIRFMMNSFEQMIKVFSEKVKIRQNKKMMCEERRTK